jgi:hypothetical protein
VAAVVALVADVLLVELELRGGFRGRVRPARRDVADVALAGVVVVRGFGGRSARYR